MRGLASSQGKASQGGTFAQGRGRPYPPRPEPPPGRVESGYDAHRGVAKRRDTHAMQASGPSTKMLRQEPRDLRIEALMEHAPVEAWRARADWKL